MIPACPIRSITGLSITSDGDVSSMLSLPSRTCPEMMIRRFTSSVPDELTAEPSTPTNVPEPAGVLSVYEVLPPRTKHLN